MVPIFKGPWKCNTFLDKSALKGLSQVLQTLKSLED